MGLLDSIKNTFLPEKDPDIVMLKKIRRKVGDVAQANLSFLVDFPAIENAEILAYALEKKGFKTEIFQNHDKTFTCQAKKDMPLETDRIKAMTSRFNELAIRMGGEFTGWQQSE